MEQRIRRQAKPPAARSAASITALQPITIRDVNDFDVQVVHMFSDDTGNISVGLTTAGALPM